MGIAFQMKQRIPSIAQERLLRKITGQFGWSDWHLADRRTREIVLREGWVNGMGSRWILTRDGEAALRRAAERHAKERGE